MINNAINLLLQMLSRLSHASKRTLQILLDYCLLVLAAWLAFQLRLGFGYNVNPSQILMIAIAPLCAIPIFVRFGLYRQVLRYLPERVLLNILEATGLASVLWLAIVFFSGQYGGTGVPRSVPMLYFLLAMTTVAATRYLAKWAIFGRHENRKKGSRTIIYGAGEAGTQLVHALASSPDASVVGFVDDDSRLHGRDVAGHRVHSPASLPDLVRNLGVESIVLCVPSVAGTRKLEIVSSLAKLPVKTQIVPSISDIASGRYIVDNIQKIELADLIGRSRVPPDLDLIGSVVRGKRVVVTGAGGSIGSALVNLIWLHAPRSIVLIDNNEFALFEVSRKLNSLDDTTHFEAVLASAADEVAMEAVFDKHQPEIVFHAAAYKHVDLVERNPAEAIRNNIGSTEVLARLSYSRQVQRFVLISSDKAVKPTNVMGATKRASELITRKYAEDALTAGSGQVFLAVRFGNVVGSRGSVVPLFEEQIRNGGPVTVTDRRMTRYFMSISEAVELIVQAAGLADGGETFLLEMGEPISIYELARNMIGMSGLTVRDDLNPSGDIEIIFTGAKAGEKIREELFYDPANNTRTRHPKIVKAKRFTSAHEYIMLRLHELMATTVGPNRAESGDKLFEVLRDAEARRQGLAPEVAPTDSDNEIANLNVTPLRPRK
ncbi:MAG: nucleoside-diphosphate sugar epimerase/dehydratase [Ahrensia sp.]